VRDDSFECGDSRRVCARQPLAPLHRVPRSPRLSLSVVGLLPHPRRADEASSGRGGDARLRRGKRQSGGTRWPREETAVHLCATTSLFANTATRPRIPFRLRTASRAARGSFYHYCYFHAARSPREGTGTAYRVRRRSEVAVRIN